MTPPPPPGAPPPGSGPPPPPDPSQGPPPGYQQYGYQQYGQPSYGYGGGQVREHPDGTTVLVLGILGLVVCGILAPFAWVKGNKAKAEMDAQPGVMWSNRGSIQAGRICGIIGTVLIAVSVVFLAIIVAAAAASA